MSESGGSPVGKPPTMKSNCSNPWFAYLSFFLNAQIMNRKITTGSKICNWSKLWNSLGWYWCYILTVQALTCIKGSWVQTSRPIWNNFTGILILTKGPNAILNQSCDPPQLQGSVHLCKLNDCQWRASTTKRNDCLLTGKLLCVTCKFWLKLRKKKTSFGH